MNYVYKKGTNNNGQEMMLPVLDVEYQNRCLTIGEISRESAIAFCSAIRCLAHDSKDPITLYITSPGGAVDAGLYMFDTLKECGCPIVTVACGMAASMGAFLLTAAGSKGMRYALPHAEILIHQPLGGTSGQASDMKIHVEHILSVREKLNRILAESTNQSIDKIANDTERDKILCASDALAYGLIDHIGDPSAEL